MVEDWEPKSPKKIHVEEANEHEKLWTSFVAADDSKMDSCTFNNEHDVFKGLTEQFVQ